MYIRGWAVMTCNVPAREIFCASRSSNFYLLILLLWLLLCTLPVGFVIASTRPSRRCGPFAQHDHFYTVITKEIEKRVDPFLLGYIRHIASPGVVIPILLFLMLIIYFLVSLVRGLREANTDLQQQLIHERTEEKKKIFELAGGKKKVDQDRDRDHRKAIQYLPLIEQQRREPWRTYNEPHDEPLRAEDSSESEEEDVDESPSPVPLQRYAPVPSSTSETVAAMHFHPSLGSLDEREEAEEEDCSQVNEPPQPIVHSTSQQFSSNARNGSPSESFEVPGSVVDITTPDDVRALLLPFIEMRALPHARGYRSFPRDIMPSTAMGARSGSITSSRGTLLESGVQSPPASSSVVLSSRRSSKRHSYISLYDFIGSVRDDNATYGAPTLITAQRPRNSQEMRAEVHRLPPTKESEEEAERRAKSGVNNTPTNQSSLKSGNSFNTDGTHSAFQPWPSIEEVQSKKEQLLKKTPLPFYKTHVQNSGQSSGTSTPHSHHQPGPSTKHTSGSSPKKPTTLPYRKFEPEASPVVSSTDDERRSASPSRRFRISVSPTRRIGTDSSPGRKARRFTIKQESAAPSLASVSQLAPPTPTTPKPDSNTSSSRAPTVEFGEDDSPRVLE
ncbi:hypothetical protein OSTOST_03862 [Ostertagia ostertagi]